MAPARQYPLWVIVLICWVSGGLALWLVDHFVTWHQLYLVMGSLMLIGVYATLSAKEPLIKSPSPKTLYEAIYEPFIEFFSRNNAWITLLLIIFIKWVMHLLWH
ncbi:hypothetical protein ARSQ2_00823 [Arsenophonus endosymbiont of Bemisia tabaci Q2]|nr:hypothetical protein ARSQ2_00823 [Arsenophonus endosymbiont of Bemisia tabaci Q2]